MTITTLLPAAFRKNVRDFHSWLSQLGRIARRARRHHVHAVGGVVSGVLARIIKPGMQGGGARRRGSGYWSGDLGREWESMYGERRWVDGWG